MPPMIPKATENAAAKIPDDLIDAIRNRRCILFVGAGLSKEAGYPDGKEVARRLRLRLSNSPFTGRGDPTLQEVAQELLADKKGSRTELIAAITEALQLQQGRNADTRTFRLVANIPHLTHEIITTNWDNLIERTIEEETGKRPHLVIQDVEIGQVANQPQVLYKIHGTLEREGTVVVTLSDYDRLRNEIFDPKSLLWTRIRSLLTQNVVVFVGYDLQDGYFETFLEQIRILLTDTSGFRGSRQYAVIPRGSTPLRDYNARKKQASRKHLEILDVRARGFFEAIFQQTSEFKNRLREINLLMESQCPYVEIVGNVGSGKTRLLREIGVRYRQDLSWPNVVYVDLEHTDPPFAWIAERLGDRRLKNPERLHNFAKANGLLILLDSVDRLDESRLKKLGEEFVAKIVEPSDRSVARIIWATRYSISGLVPDTVKYNMDSVSLQMLNETDVAQLIKQYSSVIMDKRLNDSEALLWAKSITRLTGHGHPGLIKEALRLMSEDPVLKFNAAYIQSNEGKHEISKAFIPIVEPVLPKDATIRDALINTLCIPRAFHQELLRHLEEHTLLDMDGYSLDEFEKRLISTHLFDINSYPQHQFDPTIRHALGQMVLGSRSRQIHAVCGEYYWQTANNTTEDLQRAYLCEWLFHRSTQLLSDESDPDIRFEEFEKRLRGFVFRSASSRSSVRMSDEISQDREAKATLERCVQCRYSELMNLIETMPNKP